MTHHDPTPAEQERAPMTEAGYRCAVQTCATVVPVEIDHIESYTMVRTHEHQI
ncbi:hypothetical protein [Mycobacterium sp. OTB74]|jgi:hypothetical protein|uniref:hypothetical protein n=1 Tax=Mycobacterium sp. OTB74 TaxID=1853452 RepID=UPI002473C561|nr:hypothetical protein [Mycobacterium sp. OTB74]MDH6247034.1 hypothetical protein [Mycobacterium sp. OTB74]